MYYPGPVGVYPATSGGYCGSVGFQVGQVIMRLKGFLLSAQYGPIQLKILLFFLLSMYICLA